MKIFLIYAILMGLILSGKALAKDEDLTTIIVCIVFAWVIIPIGFFAYLFQVMERHRK